MSSIRFHCAICGAGLDVDRTSAGRVAECPGCRHVVPVPGQLADSLAGAGSEGTLAVLPRGVLALEVKFLCGHCDAKLRIDARLEGSQVTCPRCSTTMRVPLWSSAPVGVDRDSGSRTAELSEAEIEFLSGPHEFTTLYAAAR